MAGGPPYPTGGGFRKGGGGRGYPSEFPNKQKHGYDPMRPCFICSGFRCCWRLSFQIVMSWGGSDLCAPSCFALLRIGLYWRPPSRPGSRQRGYNYIKSAQMIRYKQGAYFPIYAIYLYIIYYIYMSQFRACFLCAQIAKYHAILCLFALSELGYVGAACAGWGNLAGCPRVSQKQYIIYNHYA